MKWLRGYRCSNGDGLNRGIGEWKWAVVASGVACGSARLKETYKRAFSRLVSDQLKTRAGAYESVDGSTALENEKVTTCPVPFWLTALSIRQYWESS